MTLLFPPRPHVSLPVLGRVERFPVHRIYCLVRNYAEHAKEMGSSGDEAPFFFVKPSDADALLPQEPGETRVVRYPPLTARLHPELELVIAVGAQGRDIKPADAARFVFGYAVGFDMTRHDMLLEMAKKERPWCVGKSFDESGVIGPISPAGDVDVSHADITLRVNGELRQKSNIASLIWDTERLVVEASKSWELRAGDLIYTGTPAGVAPVVPGDLLVGSVTGLPPLEVRIAER